MCWCAVSLFVFWLALRARQNAAQLIKYTAILHTKTSTKINVLFGLWQESLLLDVVLFRRRGRGKRRHRYAVIDEDEDDKLESMEMLPKGGKRLKGFVTFRSWNFVS